MNPRARVAVVAGHAVGWCIIIGFVVLLTLIFNFLGTLICAALAGMMMGSARLPRRYCLVVSFIFPVVIATVLQVWRAELSGQQIIVLSALCFGVFWAIWGVMFVLCSNPANSGKPEIAQPVVRGGSNLSTSATCRRLKEGVPGTAEGNASCAEESGLAHLQGAWVPQSAVPGPSKPGKLLEIKRETAVITCFNEKGEVRSKVQAMIKVDGFLLPVAGTNYATTPSPVLEFSI